MKTPKPWRQDAWHSGRIVDDEGRTIAKAVTAELAEQIVAEHNASCPCPACGGPMRPVQVHNALSRYTDTYICSPCGTREALEGYFWLQSPTIEDVATSPAGWRSPEGSLPSEEEEAAADALHQAQQTHRRL